MKVLIIGLGSIGKKHVNALLSLSYKVEIFALRSTIDNERYENVINIYNKQDIPKDLTFAIISCITSAHESVIYEMIDLNIPLFIEKPVLSNLKNAKLLSDKINRKNIITYIACNLRFLPSIEFIKNLLTSKILTINEVNIYCGSYLPEWRTGKDFRNTYSSKSLEGGGVNLDLIHEIDYCTWLFGFPEKSFCINSNSSSLNIDVNDCARYIFEYPKFTVGITLNYFRRRSKREIEIILEDDTIIVDLINNVVISEKLNNNLFKNDYNILDTYKIQMKYFIDCIESNIKPMNDFDYSIKVLKLALNE